MDKSSRSAMIAAALILAGFGAAAYFLPSIMMAAVEISPYAAGLVAIVFMVAFFLVFWLRGQSRKGKD